MSSIFSEKDPNVKVLIPCFQRSLSLYYNNKTLWVGFVDREIYEAYPEMYDGTDLEDPLSVEDLNKRKICLVLKHSKWISPTLLKSTC